ncbi:RHS repeat domain-containing protein [Burkholderia sp. Bp8998]|uniref:RHS repeat domain-containing protein n=1 Tax=Burkholderia sp. Bp8998 TaxID=2184557 RepID=UPI000F5B1909|nr:RHS repeat-associated core domain-containing protein [Burkholderia sp. Bp8998]RQS16630.1 hypothetical protein DIE06_20375 [Burkholderia sp. Bp8998]
MDSEAQWQLRAHGFPVGRYAVVQEAYHDRQGGEALTYLYESNSCVPLDQIDQGKAAADDADVGDAVYYFHNDVSGLPEELTDADGELVWQARYKVWGNAVQEEWIARAPQRDAVLGRSVRGRTSADSCAAVTEPAVPGQYLYRETGLHYNTFRFYDPDLGRFINPDPIGLMGGVNLYQYAPNSVTWIDPLGLSCDLTEHRKDHILNRHRYGAGKPGKTEVPSHWSDSDIFAACVGCCYGPAFSSRCWKMEFSLCCRCPRRN